MNDLDALLAGIVAHPHEPVRWLIVADWLDDHDQPDRAELLRLHRMMIDTCCEPDQHPERATWQARIVELIDQGVKPCVPQHTLVLPGGWPLVCNFIPPGSFLMGSERGEGDEKPVHKVTITKGFLVGIHPITRIQWRAVMGTNPSQCDFVSSLDDARPVDSVSWDDAVAFCSRIAELSAQLIRLPTEAEWEYACRAGTTTHFHFGDAPDLGRMNYNAEEMGDPGHGKTSLLGRYVSNPWGLCDCHGNILEWCRDWYTEGYYTQSPEENPESRNRPRFATRVLRGGHFGNYPENCSASRRGAASQDQAAHTFGFRVVFTPA